MDITSVIPTGTELDQASGIGGLSGGRVTELYGTAGAGHATVALRAIATAQQQGRVCAVIDCDRQLDVAAAASLGIDLGKVLISQPDTREQTFDIINTLVRSTAVDLVVVLGIGDLRDQQDNRFIRQLTAYLARVTTAVVFVNDLGAPTGSTTLRFYSSVRVMFQRRPGGIWVKVVKNKLWAPFTEALIADAPAADAHGWCPELD